MMLSRAWHGALALVATANLLLQLVLTAAATDDTLGVRLVRLLSYFTIQSNVLVIIASATLARAPGRDGRWWRVLRLDALVCIAVTGAVYLVVLRPVVHNEGWGVVTDTVFHYVVPLLWLAYTLARGAIVHEYPYPFVDVDALGYGQVLLNCLGVAALFTALAAAAWGVDRRLPARATDPATRSPDAASAPLAP
jgi:hypothetical protein